MRTKSQIKVDRLFMVFIGNIGIFGAGYFLATEEFVKMIIVFIIAAFCLFRVDNLNNDLEYGRYKKNG